MIAITFWSFLGLRLRQASEGKPLPVKKEGRQVSGPKFMEDRHMIRTVAPGGALRLKQ